MYDHLPTLPFRFDSIWSEQAFTFAAYDYAWQRIHTNSSMVRRFGQVALAFVVLSFVSVDP
jgi:hypothetical protein